MEFPFVLLSKNLSVFPLFGDFLKGKPYIFSSANEWLSSMNGEFSQYEVQQKAVWNILEHHNATWGIGKYGENRYDIVKNFSQMETEQRYFHVGVDIIAPADTPVYAPLDGVVHTIGFDGGLGNYGGYIIVKHELFDLSFYSLYGHLRKKSPVKEGEVIYAGQCIGALGAHEESGQWFSHTHLQILTEKAVASGRTLQGYVTEKEMEKIDELFPSPYFLLRY